MDAQSLVGKMVYVNSVKNTGFNGKVTAETPSFIELVEEYLEHEKGCCIRIYTHQIHFIRVNKK